MGSLLRSPTARLLRAQALPSAGQGACAVVRTAARGCAFAPIGDNSKRQVPTLKLAVHGRLLRALDAGERSAQPDRDVLGAIVLLLLVGEGSVVQVIRRLIGG